MIIFVQTTPSQLDAPFYSRLAEHLPGRTRVIVWNEYGSDRRTVDPELGLVPQFPHVEYPVTWLDRREQGVFGLFKMIMAHGPKVVVLQDQSWMQRLVLSFLLRTSSVRVGMRSDKNALSENARAGFGRRLEGFVVRRGFDLLVPISPLTTAYYEWPARRDAVPFPYCSDERKFASSDGAGMARAHVRESLGINASARVFLGVVKFSERENPHAALEAFARVQRDYPNAWLVMVGAGPLLDREKEWVTRHGVGNVLFAGYVPYAKLESFFFAADALVHLPRVGPWEVSVTDALLAGKGVVATRVVGSASLLLDGSLQRFLLDTETLVERASSCMAELCTMEDIARCFEPARAQAMASFSVGAVVRRWLSWTESIDRELVHVAR